MSEEKKEQFAKIAKKVIEPIMQKMFEVAFNGMLFDDKEGKPVHLPTGVKEGLLEELEQVIDHCKSQASFYDSASIIGFAMGKDGFAPGRKYRSMTDMVTALRDLIKAKDEQIKMELSGTIEHRKQMNMAAMLGF